MLCGETPWLFEIQPLAGQVQFEIKPLAGQDGSGTTFAKALESILEPLRDTGEVWIEHRKRRFRLSVLAAN
jgi:hypothetical protein